MNGHARQVPDNVGAYVIHALMVCNTSAALELCMELFELVPATLAKTHDAPLFTGEGCLHIACANRREEHACKMLDLAQRHLAPDEFRAMMSSQASGSFFDTPPMCWYGETPIAYACVFSLKRVVRKMLDTGLVSLDTSPGVVCGLYPLHAVTINGLRDMYDFLTRE